MIRTILLWSLFAGWAAAETLDVLVLEVDRKFVEPALDRAFGGDRDALEDAIGKLRKLAPDKGVVEHMAVSLEQKPDIRNPSTRLHQPAGEIAKYKRLVHIGHKLTWYEGARRELELETAWPDEYLPHFRFQTTHQPDGRWSLSAAVSSPRGALLLFEKIEGRPLDAGKSNWVAASLPAGRSTRTAGNAAPWRVLGDPAAGEAALLRIPAGLEPEQATLAAVDRRRYSAIRGGFSPMETSFGVGAGKWALAGRPVARVDFRQSISETASEQISQRGLIEVGLVPGKQAKPAQKEFEVTELVAVRKGGGYAERIAGKKPERTFRTQAFEVP